MRIFFLTVLIVVLPLNILLGQKVDNKTTSDVNPITLTDEEQDPKIRIFPVPVLNNRFTITSDIPFTLVRMTNIIGQEITREKHNYPIKRDVIEFSNAERGIYLVTIVLEDNRKIVRKILVDTSR